MYAALGRKTTRMLPGTTHTVLVSTLILRSGSDSKAYTFCVLQDDLPAGLKDRTFNGMRRAAMTTVTLGGAFAAFRVGAYAVVLG